MVRKQRVSIPELGNLASGKSGMLTLAESVALIADRVRRNGENDRGARDRVRKRITYHVEIGSLRAYKGKLAIDELGAFLHTKYPTKFDDLPPFNAGAGTAVGVSEVIGLSDCYDALVLPGDIPRCHAEITRLSGEVGKLGRELNAARQRIAELEPHAERWRQHTAQLRKNAQRPRNV